MLQHGIDLWRLLTTITLFKVQEQINHHLAQKRSLRREQNFGSEDSLLGIQAEVLAREASPMDAVILLDEVELLMRELTPEQKSIVELRLQGYKQVEIAKVLRCSESTVIRVLNRVKEYLAQEQADNS